MPGETEEAGAVHVLGPVPPTPCHQDLSPQPLPPSSARETGPRTQSAQARCSRQGPVWLGGTPCFPPLTSASSKYTQRVMLCRIMPLVYSSCLFSKELRSLRSSPESPPCRSRSMARPRQPTQPVQAVDSERRQNGVGRRGRTRDKAALPLLKSFLATGGTTSYSWTGCGVHGAP